MTQYDLSGTNYSQVDAANNNQGAAGMPEGMPPSFINDAWRAGMGAIKRAYDWDHGGTWAAVTGTANAIVITYPVAPNAYVQGQKHVFKATAANTGAATININSLGVKNIFQRTATGPAALTGGEIQVGDIVELAYDGTEFVMVGLASNVNPPQSAGDAGKAVLATGSGGYALGGPIFGFKNLLINGDFSINQRSYASGAATTGANQYTLDRWRVVTSGQNLTFAASGRGNTVTAPAGGVEQVIEAANIEGGTYTLSWTGTATATVNGSAVANGATVTLPANTNATVRFSGGTASNAQLELGKVATGFDFRPASIELALCQRYYETGISTSIGITPGGTTFGIDVPCFFKATKRATPTMAATQSLNGSASSASVSSNAGDLSGFTLAVSTSAGAGQFGTTATWTASAEL